MEAPSRYIVTPLQEQISVQLRVKNLYVGMCYDFIPNFLKYKYAWIYENSVKEIKRFIFSKVDIKGNF